MEELIFFAIVILFSVLESIARARKRRGEVEAPAPEPGEWEERPSRWEPEAEEEYGYEGRGSFDEAATADEAESVPAGAPGHGPRRSSEEMLPSEIWEELGELMRGRVEETPRPEAPPPPLPEEVVVRPGPVHRIHLTHPEYGTDPSSRTPVALPVEPPTAGLRHRESLIRTLSGAGGAQARQEAFILQEVLGPPVSLRDER